MLKKIKDTFHAFECILADIFYGFPGKKIKVIGVTGTDGKTTTSHLIYHILSQAGKKVSLISSVYADIGGALSETGFHVTTPRPWTVRSYLKKAVDAGSEFFVLETTSHALEQNRVWGILFSYGAITNITHEHLYHHGSFGHYVDIKSQLLLRSEKRLINKDAQVYLELCNILKRYSKSFSTYSVHDIADFTWSKDIKTSLPGEYNQENIMAAYGVCSLIGIDRAKILKGISTFSPPIGRFEIAYNGNFTVIIDFAHTPNSLEKVLQTIKKDIKPPARLIHVFGSASQRDDSKRPLMGEASARYADIVILTEEDYRKENINHICSQIAIGLEKNMFKKVEHLQSGKTHIYAVVPNREEAINRAVELAQKNDVIVLTGKSHEKSLNRNGVEYPWDEFKALNEAIHTKKNAHI